MKRPLFSFGILLMLSLAAIMQTGVWMALGLVPGVAFLLLLFPRRRRRQQEGLLWCVCFAFLSAAAVLSIFDWRLAVASRIDGAAISFTGYVADDSAYDPYVKMVRAQSGEMGPGEITLWLKCYEEDGLEPGDWISGTAVIGSAGADGKSLLSLGISYTAVAGELQTAQPPEGLGLLWKAARLRHQLSQRMMLAVPDDATAVVTGLLFSQKAYIPREIMDSFNYVSTEHILSVSGFHMSVAVGWVLWLCRRLRLGRVVTLLLGLGMVLLVCAMAGFRLPVLRAGMMTVLWLVAEAIRRRADGLTSLAVAACVLLALCPWALWDLGFLMSFSAAFGLLVLATPMAGWMVGWWESHFGRGRKLVKTLASLVAIPLAAQLAILPVTMAEFGYAPLYSPIANMLISPFVWPALLFGAFGAVCFAVPVLGAAGPFFTRLAGLFARGIIGVCTLFDRIPGGIFPLQLPYQQAAALGALGTAALCILLRIEGRNRTRVLCGGLALCLAVGLGGTLYYNSRVIVTAAPEGTVVVRKGSRALLLFDGEGDFELSRANSLLLRTGLSHTRLRVLARPQDTTPEGDYAAALAHMPQVLLLHRDNFAKGLPRMVEGVEVLPLAEAPVEIWNNTVLSGRQPYRTLLEADGKKILKLWAGYGIITEADIPPDIILLIDLQGNVYSPGGRVAVRRLWSGDSVAVLPG